MRFNYFLLTLVTLVFMYAIVNSRIEAVQPKKTQCKIGYVYDGDTVELICDGNSRPARLIGFDAPETFQASCDAELAQGRKATARLKELLELPDITFREDGIDKYGRVLVELQIQGVNIGDVLIREGLAVKYDGGKRIQWCDRL